ncbi:MAG: hypothetical protein EXR05_10020 [Acetobacteraceae bacterium]|nr:hypothetical protein [Acetobacteraceae bacterium]MSP29646.1 hypothetical protein [Acetobacteraceae bacterium]
MARQKILIDCDPDHDDAVAILYAARHLDGVGITPCHGYTDIENVTHNALSILTFGGLDISLVKGGAAPLNGKLRSSAEAHGSTGLDGAVLPVSRQTAIEMHAVEFLIEQALTYRDELMLAVIGPVVEYNTSCDPKAAAILFACGAPSAWSAKMSPHAPAPTKPTSRICTGTKTSREPSPIYLRSIAPTRKNFSVSISPPCMMAAPPPPIVDDTQLTYRHCHVGVGLSGTLTRGMMVCDLRTFTRTGQAIRGVGLANARVTIGANAPKLISAVVETLQSVTHTES